MRGKPLPMQTIADNVNRKSRPKILIIPNWLSAAACETLMRRWRRSHAERGYADAKGTEQFDRRRKYRFDQVVHQSSTQKWLSSLTREALRPLGFRGGRCEAFRIGRYGCGGHFTLHTDSTKGREWSIVCVLNQPTQYSGGALKFPEIGVSMRPSAGTAIFFDPHLRHGVDPVKSGFRFVLIGFAYK